MTHIEHGGKGISGMASLGDELFIVNFSSKQQVEVYRASTFTLRRFLVVPGLSLGGSCDLAVCERNSCLYVPDWFTNTVHRVELSGGNEVMKWSVERNPVGLSVNGDDHLIVCESTRTKVAGLYHPWNPAAEHSAASRY